MTISKTYKGPVVVICGPTGSGKTGAAVALAKKIGGEVISADSRAIYKYMNIGTAKPDMSEREGVPHFGFDLVEPGERFTVADWKEYAEKKIAEIRKRGHVPIIAGGTGLYIDALVFDYKFKKTGVASEQKNCSETAPDRAKMAPGYLLYGIKWESKELRERLKLRADKMFCDELYAETKFLVEKYGWGSQAMKSNIYQFVWKFLNGEIDFCTAVEQFFYDDWHLAKRQMTWFKRNPEINWVRLDKIEQKIEKDLAKNL